MADKIKAIQPMITVGGKIEKPCYSITYYDTSDKMWHIGFGSFDLANVKKWLKEDFEVVAETADVAEAKWIDVNERLPEKNVRVLVYLKENACDYTRIDTDRRIDTGKWIRWGNNVTHWMLLPEPPNSAKMDGGKEE